MQPILPKSINLRGYKPERKADDLALHELIGLLKTAKAPMIYCGGGVISGSASKEILEFAERTQVPVATTLMGVGGFPETHPLSMHWFGMHGSAYGNWAVDQCDLLLCVGARFDDRITGDTRHFATHAKIVHIDIDASEHNKNKRAHLPIVGDIKDALTRLNKMLTKRPVTKKFDAWHAQIAEWKKKGPFAYGITPEIANSDHMKDHLTGNESEIILQQMVVETLYDLTKGDAYITTGVGQHQMWAGQWYKYKFPRQFVTSGGLGSMGYGYPAALGVKVAHPDKQVIDIDGDGSFVMNIQELATCKIEKIAAKAMILNNQHLGMVVQWEDNFYAGNRGHTYLGDPKDRPAIYPDYVKVCTSFGVKCERVMYKKDLRAAMQRMLDSDEPYVLDVVTPYSTHVIPFIPAGRTVADMIWKA